MNYLKSFYTSSPSISIKLDKNNHNYFQYISKDNIIYSLPTYFDNDKISGEIELNLNNNKSIILDSLTIYLIGILQNQNSKISDIIFQENLQILGHENPQNIISKITKYNFSFKPKNKPYETYMGNSTQIKYFINAIANINMDDNFSKIEKKIEICCLKPASKKVCDDYYLNKDLNKSLNVNIGIENVIHVNIKLLKTKYCLDDVIVGKMKIVKSELQLTGIFLEIKREEKINVGNTNLANCEDLARYELVEGYPESGDEIHFRYYLNGVKNLTPSYKNENNNDDRDKENKLEVRYFLAFEFNDNKGYQFFKNIEITIYRMNLNNLNLKDDKKESKENNDEGKFISIKKELKSK